MNGIICINKPKDFTSFDVIAKLRGITRFKKLGHSGTLDPMATGVLPVFFGHATKACDIMPDGSKSYRATFRLGLTTDTLDITGKVLSQKSCDVSYEQIAGILGYFRGDIMQVPPMYSAVSINGRRLYDIARSGQTIEREARHVTIDKLELLGFDEKTQTGVVDVDCSKGTYIRSLISDIGEKLGCGATLTELVRTRAGMFNLSDCVTIEDMQKISDTTGDFSEIMLPIERVFDSLPKIKLNEFQTRLFINGVKLDLNRVIHEDADGFHSVYSFDKQFLGLATADKENEELRIYKMFCERV